MPSELGDVDDDDENDEAGSEDGSSAFDGRMLDKNG